MFANIRYLINIFRFTILTFYLFFAQIAYTQPGTNDASFNVIDACGINGYGASHAVNSQAIQQDGKIIVGGDFTTFNGLEFNRLVRLNNNGNVDLSFNIGSGFNAVVYSVIVQTDGKILVGGDFTNFNGTAVNRIVRLNTNGSIDLTFQSIADGAVRCISIQNNKILIGGDFFSFNNSNGLISYLARINMDGSTDMSFNNTCDFSGGINVIKQQSDGKIIVGGSFTLATLNSNTVTARRLARLNSNGDLDPTFNVGASFGFADGAVNAIDILQDGTIVVGGSFTAKRIAFLDPTGYNSVTASIGTGFNGVVNSVLVQSDNTVLVGGAFSQFNGVSNNIKIIRLNSNATIDNSFVTGFATNSTVNAINIQTDGKILIGGIFSLYNNIPTNKNIMRVNNNGSLDLSFKRPLGITGVVNTIENQSNGRLIVGGQFSTYNGVLKNCLVRIHPNGEVDNSFNSGTGFSTGPTTLGEIYSIAVQQDGKILVGGVFLFFNGISTNYIIRLNPDGSVDNSFNMGSGFNNSVRTIVLQDDGKVLIGGVFTQFNGATANRIIRLNPDGSVDNSFNMGLGCNNEVMSIVLQSDGKILMGGLFTQYNGITSNRIIRLNLDGTIDNSFNIGSGFNSNVGKIGVNQIGKIVVSGGFTSYNGVPRNSFCQLNNNGSLDVNFTTGTGLNGSTFAMIVQPDGKIIAGGNFSTYNGTTSNRIVRINTNGSIDNSFNVGIGFIGIQNNEYVKAIHFLNEQYIVGGVFTKYNNFCRDNIVRINGDCPSSYTYDSIQSCGSYTWVNGLTYNSNINDLVYTLPNSSGCDSIVILNLNINEIPIMPNGNNQQSLCSGTLGNLSVSGSQIKWYSSTIGGTALNQTSTLQNNATYYASQTVNGCESTDRLAVTVTILAPSSPSGTSSQTFCNAATVNNLSATGTSIQWYNAASGGTALAASTALVNGQNYYASQTENNCESQQRLVVSVTINSPTAPTGLATQNFCNSATVGDLSAIGTNVQWFNTSTGGTPLATSTVLGNGNYFASQTINNCESANRLTVTVSVFSNPNTSVTLNGNTLTASQQGATYQWLNCDNNLSPITGANQMSYTPLVSGNYAVRITINGCTSTSNCTYVQVLTGSIDENEDSFIINLYPNPNTGTFTFETTLTGKYVVMNNLGQIIAEFNIEYPSQKEINLDKPSKGVYYIKHAENQTRPTKLIIH